MADNFSREDAQLIAEELAKALGKDTDKTTKIDAKNIDEMIKQTQKFTESIKKSTPSLSLFNKTLMQSDKNVNDAIKKLNKAIMESTDVNEISVLQEEKRNIEKAVVHKAQMESLVNLNKALKQSAGNLLNGAGTFIKGLQSDASGMELASGAMTAAVDAAGTTGAALGGIVGTVGSGLATFGKGPLKAVGRGMEILGPALGAASEGAAKLAKFGIEVLSKEVEKTVKAFNDMSSSGALFGNGMTDMRSAAGGAGLTVDQFSRVVKGNSELIAQSGLGVAEGAKQIGRVGADLKKSGVQKQLLQLGYSFEEQAQLTAEVIADMRKAAGGTVSDKEAAEQTQKYAENLRLIASITGEDAKKKMEQVRAENVELAFQQKMAGMSKDQRAQLNAAMANMTEQERKNLRERMVLGSVINREGAIYEATVAGAREKGEETADILRNNNLTAKETANLNAKYGDQIKESVLSQRELGIASMFGAESLKGSTKAMGDALQQANTYTADNVKNAQKGVDEQGKTQDELTKSVVGAEQAAQDLKLALQEELTPAIKNFAKVSEAMLGQVRSMLKDVGVDVESSKKTKAEKVGEGVGEVAGMGLGGWGGWAAGAASGAAIGSVIPGIGTAVGGIIGGLLGSSAGGWLGGKAGEWLGGKTGKAIGGEETKPTEKPPEYASGGVASGPTSGFRALLHGIEAVIPLPDGKTVPVNVKLPEMPKQDTSTPIPVIITGDSSKTAGVDSVRNLVPSIISSIMPGFGIGGSIAGMAGNFMNTMNNTGEQTSKKPAETKMEALKTETTAGFGELADIMRRQLDATTQLLSYNDDIRRHVESSKQYTERLLQATI